uniref:PDZ domain-containing protein n=1 Tax=Noctiluca scintillans TaxID=2966 RepID=A0A7S1FKM4_NOCSC|mmetsp:Transcript_9532/g.26647  ORF Transcript_9532/g.26647 Transcript_9532/m.26647 type:complete len:201 (+) Transcript_9532:31-633(+)
MAVFVPRCCCCANPPDDGVFEVTSQGPSHEIEKPKRFIEPPEEAQDEDLAPDAPEAASHGAEETDPLQAFLEGVEVDCEVLDGFQALTGKDLDAIQAEDEIMPGEQFVVEVERRDDADCVGLKVQHSAKKSAVRVHTVRAGPVEEWNAQNPRRMVMQGDRLLEVNGVRGPSAVDICQRLKVDHRLRIVVSRRKNKSSDAT